MEKNLHEGHRERLRAKLETYGMQGLADHEKLEYLLFPFVPRRDTNPIAHDLIHTFGSFRQVLDAEIDDLAAVKGVSRNAALFLHLLPSLFNSYASEGAIKNLRNTRDAAEYAKGLIGNESNERLICFFLSGKGSLIKVCDIASGEENNVTVSRETVIRLAIQCKAKVLILSHNHPSGNLYPSQADIEATNELIRALSLVGIRIWDHIVVSGKDFLRMFEKGLLQLPPEDDSRDKRLRYADSAAKGEYPIDGE